MPKTITLRDGEPEALGMIYKVSYAIAGEDVLITALDGIARGTTFRYTITGPDLARTELGDLHRMR